LSYQIKLTRFAILRVLGSLLTVRATNWEWHNIMAVTTSLGNSDIAAFLGKNQKSVAAKCDK
jgi:hypothetical protein